MNTKLTKLKEIIKIIRFFNIKRYINWKFREEKIILKIILALL